MIPRITNRPSPANIALIDNGVIPCISRMQATGVCVNRDALSDLAVFLDAECARVTGEIEACTNICIEPSKDAQVRDLLFHQLKVHAGSGRKLKLTATGLEAAGKLEIEPYLGAHPAVGLVLQFRQFAKLRGTYAVGLMNHARKCSDGAWRIFYTIKPYATDTGRLAGEDPNPMNIPQRTELGRRIKGCFIPSPGCRMFEVDFSQIEMRVAAHEAQAAFMSDMFMRGMDVHKQTAMRVYGLPESEIDEMRHRYPMKRAGFLILYLGDGRALQVQLNAAEAQDPAYPHAWTEAECDDVIAGWYKINPEIRDWQEEQFARMNRYNMVWTMYGRVRLVPEVKSVHSWIRGKGMRQGANQPVQGGAADMFRIALKQLHDVYAGLRERLHGRVEALVPVHDAVLGEAAEDWAEDVAAITRDVMENVARLRVPVKADAKVGKFCYSGWSDLSKMKG